VHQWSKIVKAIVKIEVENGFWWATAGATIPSLTIY
jgi:hypothetical protein